MTKWTELVIERLGLKEKSKLVQIVAGEMLFLTLVEESYHSVTEHGTYGGTLGKKLSDLGAKQTNNYFMGRNSAIAIVFDEEDIKSFEYQMTDLTEQWSNDISDRFERETGLKDTWGKLREIIVELVETEEFMQAVIEAKEADTKKNKVTQQEDGTTEAVAE